MANTISVMTNAVRGVVSKKRIRYQQNGYDLDLAYVSDRLIAMGYPAENIESIFRNKIEHVYHFLEEKHKDHYKIYNLCSERHYDGNKFHGRVALYPFDDHNPPPITLIKEFCDDVDAWLKADKDNVAAVHCKAGKGRTGTMICCYLLHCHMEATAESALAYYDEKRTKNKKGVTIPSQRRYVEYYAKLVNSGQPYEERALQICEISFSPQLSNQDNIYCSIYPNPRSDDAESTNITLSFRKSQTIEINDRCIPLKGDVKIEVYRKVMKRKERYFHFWFNTYFICDKAAVYEYDGSEKKFIYELSKHELDDAHKDTEHKTVPQDFKVQLVFKLVPKYHHTTMPSATPTIANATNDANNHLKNNHISPLTLPFLNNIAIRKPILLNSQSPNNICEVNSMNATQKSPSATRLSSMGSSSSGSSLGEHQQQIMMTPLQPAPVMVDMNCYTNQDQHQQLQNQKYQQQQQNTTTLLTNNSLTKPKEDLEHLIIANGSTNNCHSCDGRMMRPKRDVALSGPGCDRISSTLPTIPLGLHTIASPDASRTNSSSRSSSINSSEVSSQSGGCGGVASEEEGWDSEFCRMDSGKGKHKSVHELGRKYSDNIVMMSTTTTSSLRHGTTTPVMPMSVPSSTSSLLNHMIQNGGDDDDDNNDTTTAMGAEITDDDDAKNDDDDRLSSNSDSGGGGGGGGDDDDDDDYEVNDKHDIMRTLIFSSPSSSLIPTSKLKPILIEPSTSERRQSSVQLGFRSIFTKSFCRKSRREST